jgi:exonuclease III
LLGWLKFDEKGKEFFCTSRIEMATTASRGVELSVTESQLLDDDMIAHAVQSSLACTSVIDLTADEDDAPLNSDQDLACAMQFEEYDRSGEHADRELASSLQKQDDIDYASRSGAAFAEQRRVDPGALHDASRWRRKRSPPVAGVSKDDRFNDSETVSPKRGFALLVVPLRAPQPVLRIVTLNINGLETKAGRCPDAFQLFVSSFDIIVLQEIRGKRGMENPQDRHLRLSKYFPRHVLLMNAGGSNVGVGIAVHNALQDGVRITHCDFVPVSTLPSASVHNFNPTAPDGDAASGFGRSITAYIPAAGISVLCVHAPFITSKLQSVMVQKWHDDACGAIAELTLAKLDFCVAGDFNVRPSGSDGLPCTLISSEACRSLREATAGTTELLQPSHFSNLAEYVPNFLRIDYILLSPGAYSRLVPLSGRVLSVGAPHGDHVPVECSLSLPLLPACPHPPRAGAASSSTHDCGTVTDS